MRTASASRRKSTTSSAHDFDALPSPTCGKTLAILDLVARHPRGITAAQAARASGITPNLVFRILKTFVALGYCLQHGTTKTYTLSGKLLEMAGPQSGDQSLVLAGHEALRALRDATGETVQLAEVLDEAVERARVIIEEKNPEYVSKIWEGSLELPSGRPAGQPIKVIYAYDINGTMQCSFEDVKTGKVTKVDLKPGN